jgi:hypothetical protein
MAYSRSLETAINSPNLEYMSKVLFIDANIYLRFFDSNSSEYKKLLQSLKEVKEHIFTTIQLRNEIDRNKLQVFLRSFKEHSKNFCMSKVSLPEHLESDPDRILKDWNIETADIHTKVKGQKEKLTEIAKKLLEKINSSEDEISTILAEIFEHAKQHSTIQLEKARGRKELGNPPGKVNDPLGDQVSWQQLLDEIDTVEEVWFITNDKDYITTFNNSCYLNTILIKELKEKKGDIKIFCFNSLADGLKSFKKENPATIPSLPGDEELKKISNEERTLDVITPIVSGSYHGTNGYSGSSGYSGISGFGPPFGYLPGYGISRMQNCPICHEKSLVGPSIKPSQFGGFSEQYFCVKCNKNIDTGETFDE